MLTLQPRTEISNPIIDSPHRLIQHDLGAILNNLSAMVGYWDKDQRNQFGNSAYASWFGTNPSQMQGMHIREVIGEALYQQNLSFIEGVLRGEPQQFERAIPSHDGKQVRYSLTEYRPDMVEGEVRGFFVQVADISNIKEAQSSLRHSEEKFRQIAENTSDGIVAFDANHQINYVSPAYAKQLGYDETEEIGRKPEDLYLLIHPEDRDSVFTNIYAAIEAKKIGLTYTYRAQHKSGHYIWREDSAKFIFDDAGVYGGAYVICRDITHNKRNEDEFRIAATAFDSQEGMMIADAKGVILRVNQAMTENSGYEAAELLGQTPRIFKSGRHGAEFYLAMWQCIHQHGKWKGEIWDRRKNGEIYPKWMTITAVKTAQGVVTHYVSTHVDISERKTAENAIQNLAFYDPLTRLANRRLLSDRLQQTLALNLHGNKCGALLFIDLDNFKTLNDTLGHTIGDKLLQQVAERLNACVRDGDTVARFGGDEFVVMLDNLSELEAKAAGQTKKVGEIMLTSLNQIYQLAGHTVRNTASIGATLLTHQSQSIDDLFKQADIAMYQAKKDGRNTLRFFDSQMQATINARVTLEDQLLKAIANQEFQLYYQIQVTSSGHNIGAEALIRWISPLHGFMSPAQFIPLAEETSLILPIGKWVLETACKQLKTWQCQHATQHLVLAVNVSAKQFQQADFVAQVSAIVQFYGINPKRLKLELTESMLVDNVEETIAKIVTLKELGIQFSLDDFGTGYSSLQYLKRLPVDQLKIDQSFVRNIEIDVHDRAIVRTVIAMAQSMEMDVIAEGVETEAQRLLLLSKGCTQFQGYLFSKPVPIGEFEALLK